MADLCQGLPQENCTFLAASGWEGTRLSHCCAWHSLGQRLGIPTQDGTAGMVQDSIQLVSAGSLPKDEQIQWAQDPHQGLELLLEQHLPSPSSCPSHPPAQQEPLANVVTLLPPALLQHQCSLCFWLQLCWVASGTPHPALGLRGKYSFLQGWKEYFPGGQYVPGVLQCFPLQSSYLQGSRWGVS